MAADNKTLGRFQLTGIAPAPRGVPQIEVAFNIDANGIVNVSAKDMGTGKEQSIKIQSSSGLSEEDIQRLVREAEAHASEDKKKQETIEARNHADSLIYGTEKSLNDLGDKVDAAVKSDVEGKIRGQASDTRRRSRTETPAFSKPSISSNSLPTASTTPLPI